MPPSTELKGLERFLAARKGNVEQAAALCRNYWHFRRFEAQFSDEHDFLQQEAPHDVKQVLADGFVEIQGRTKEGGLVLVLRSARSFPHSLPHGPISVLRGLWYALELISYDSRTQDLGVTIINDCRGAGLANAHSSLIRLFAGVFRGAFPMRVKNYLVLDPPMVFPLIWGLVRPLTSEKLASRVKVVKMKEVAKEVGKEGVGADYGGVWKAGRVVAERRSSFEGIGCDCRGGDCGVLGPGGRVIDRAFTM